ncbi:MAG TPA: hypothetical protein VIY72_02440 [Acidimicrobiales bacterium]
MVPRLIALQRSRILGPTAKQLLLALRSLDFPANVRYGTDLRFKHGGAGVVVHPLTVIGDRVTIYHRVTIGQSNPEGEEYAFGGITIEDDVILAAGCFVLGGDEPLVVRRGTVVGAGAVLLQSTGEGEVWAGVPARPIGSTNALLRRNAPPLREA